MRPYYAGGVSQVLMAYRAAAPSISVTALAGMLQDLDYAYPYHQVDGFYLSRAGKYTDTQLADLRRPGLKFGFYLAYQIEPRRFSNEWRVLYPAELDATEPLH